MKTFLFLLFLSCFIQTTYAQIFEFPDSNAVWSVSDKKFFIQGDSTINGFTYQKIFVENDSVISTGNFFALIREDLVESRVFAIYKDSINEHLLYDFSLNAGDETTVFPMESEVYMGPVDIKVDSVDSIYIYDDYRKRLKVSGVEENEFFTEYWIEGIGSTFGLFGSGLSGVVILDAHYPVLLCFEQDSILFYDNPDYSSCYHQYASVEEHSKAKNIKLYPNPASNNITIRLLNSLDSNKANYQIISLSGEVVLEGHLVNSTIDISDLDSGVYFLKVGQDGEYLGGRKVVVE